MSKRSRPDGQCRTKATYKAGHPELAPSPDKKQAAMSLEASACEKTQQSLKLAHSKG